MTLTPGKQKGLQQITNENNIIFATAMDQRGSLGKMIQSFDSSKDYTSSLSEFKEGVAKVLGNNSSSLLLDPEYGWNAAQQLTKDVGLIMAYEKTGYDATEKGRLPNLVDFYAIQDLTENGSSAVKLLIYYDHKEDEDINKIKDAFIKRVGDECKQNDILFILEPVSYSSKGLDAKSTEFAKEKPAIIEFFMEEFSKDKYGVDVLKVEVPVSIYNIEGYKVYDNYNPVFTKDEAQQHYKHCSDLSKIPFIYLSGGVTNEQFVETLHFAKEAGATFNGCLCGRAIWKDGIETYATQNWEDYLNWLNQQGLENLNKVKKAVAETASPIK
ncbi:tagatose 1,6-diphosphate aldolase [Staphylococcus kloosii]|jgi:tagatose 1,6-diphosphate aldolase|uniref:tagatose 1,6-diphosphate aldolase n=1 Tax=Staphylococcus kloosii TaxID=29384 RepID=UPI00189DEF1D|nr:tagatose 1,6-diphosphate aldolase [Staphylococcus kloosii]MBF7025340.1 tagatose 1,6-diphosphate aldolase [Staphylococcus kloosii]